MIIVARNRNNKNDLSTYLQRICVPTRPDWGNERRNDRAVPWWTWNFWLWGHSGIGILTTRISSKCHRVCCAVEAYDFCYNKVTHQLLQRKYVGMTSILSRSRILYVSKLFSSVEVLAPSPVTVTLTSVLGMEEDGADGAPRRCLPATSCTSLYLYRLTNWRNDLAGRSLLYPTCAKISIRSLLTSVGVRRNVNIQVPVTRQVLRRKNLQQNQSLIDT